MSKNATTFVKYLRKDYWDLRLLCPCPWQLYFRLCRHEGEHWLSKPLRPFLIIFFLGAHPGEAPTDKPKEDDDWHQHKEGYPVSLSHDSCLFEMSIIVLWHLRYHIGDGVKYFLTGYVKPIDTFLAGTVLNCLKWTRTCKFLQPIFLVLLLRPKHHFSSPKHDSPYQACVKKASDKQTSSWRSIFWTVRSKALS